MKRMIRVVAPHFVAGAEFEKRNGQWVCIRAAPILYWMKVDPIQNIERFLKGPAKRRGWTYEWLPESS